MSSYRAALIDRALEQADDPLTCRLMLALVLADIDTVTLGALVDAVNITMDDERFRTWRAEASELRAVKDRHPSSKQT